MFSSFEAVRLIIHVTSVASSWDEKDVGGYKIISRQTDQSSNIIMISNHVPRFCTVNDLLVLMLERRWLSQRLLVSRMDSIVETSASDPLY
jgi:hypothetical protein